MSLARVVDEPRLIVIGQINKKHWTAVITYRSERVRIISIRRARDEEMKR
ncbi:MAG: BrnT family toxin [Nostoc sp. LLA-1]|nr:BrnT family toxin [Cyanocohniella sp. LLY]